MLTPVTSMIDQQPTFSIIIPTYNRPEQLSACLHALTGLDYPRDCFEVIVMDDGSATPVDGVVAPFRHYLTVTLLRQMNTGPATARNIGAGHAQKQFLAFTDDDCTPAADWLRALAARVETAPADAIVGQTLNALPENPYATASQLLVSFLFAYHNNDPNQACFWTTSNLALPADTFRTLGGFDPAFPLAGGEDWELCIRWLSQGYRLRYAPEVVVYHAHRLSLGAFWQQHFQYGRGAFRVRQNGPVSQGRGKQDRCSFPRQLFRYLLAQTQGQQTLILSALLVVARLASTSGFFWERRQQQRETAKMRTQDKPTE